MTKSDAIQTLIVPVAGVVLLFFLNRIGDNFASKIIKRVKHRWNKKAVLKDIENSEEIAGIVDELNQLNGVKKAVVIMNELQGHEFVYSTIVYPTRWTETWNKQSVDPEYADIIRQTLSEGRVEFSADDLLIDGTLRNLFENQGVLFCITEDIYLEHTKYYFLAVDFHVKKEDITTDVYDKVRIHANSIRNKYKYG